jgi:hypothetical protein
VLPRVTFISHNLLELRSTVSIICATREIKTSCQ